MTPATPGRAEFDAAAFLPRSWYEAIIDLRVRGPDAIFAEAAARRRRATAAPDGRLLILAADHPARMVTRAGADPVGMGNRWRLLSRVLRVLTVPDVDGVMATPDVVEELLLLSSLARERSGVGWLDDKLVLGCMNRGGLSGTVFEIDDRMTAFTVEGMTRLGCDGAKMMVRIDPQDPATAAILETCAREIDRCHAADLEVFLEAFLVDRSPAGPRPRNDAESLIRATGVATGLGTSTARTWLKLPYGPGYDRVAAATTVPILMLGGEVRDDPASVLDEFAAGMAAGPTVRGALVGRNISFAQREDPRALAAAAAALVHRGISSQAARAASAEARGRDMDLVTRLTPPVSGRA
jgi:DhnA family fructose-bisphosphate aldolase class Ia